MTLRQWWERFRGRSGPGHYEKRWQDRWFTGHISFWRFTIYGANAMHWQFQYASPRFGHVCFHPTTKTFGGHWPWCFYLSPNGTPWGATFAIGPAIAAEEKQAAKWRRANWGHGYSTSYWNALYPLHPDEPMREGAGEGGEG